MRPGKTWHERQKRQQARGDYFYFQRHSHGEIVNASGVDTLPGMATVTPTVLGKVKSALGTRATIESLLRRYVERGKPFQLTTAPPTNPVPETLSAMATPTAVLELGVIADKVGGVEGGGE